MIEFAMRPARERAEVFEETAALLGLSSAVIVEKDFWVCWLLAQLFGDGGFAVRSGVQRPLVFKGGTSLSKVYGLIDRFSEDIDLVVDRSAMDPDLPDPLEDGVAGREKRRRIAALSGLCAQFVRDVVKPFLVVRCASIAGAEVNDHPEDGQMLLLAYPRSLVSSAYGAMAYVQPTVLLEFGARGQLTPAQGGTASPFVAQSFPQQFSAPSTAVWTLSAERTFWEKATILHAAANKGSVGAGERQSRHYADLAALLTTPVAAAALANDALLAEVAEHKKHFFASAQAEYDTARRGTLRLLPSDVLLREMESDYRLMRAMYLREPTPWARIVSRLRHMEDAFNSPAK